ncbi:antibiotic biosynthesis monooxygenase family protein [Streptomyces telluris]|uniref:Antibiotic biosynthesis monooxygenase n=1 Tax=Streptomyces telluris TaxID=2720021 RepID=A0A9X2RN86_9ACTN|nr:hypothetical protein [Streptomyces telluris]MCQ8771734.1 antibiotic biosynthesis monooxygenase [Streptomyces telluris]NJP78856.1 hypothetical protein [Streptomyces telluris]
MAVIVTFDVPDGGQDLYEAVIGRVTNGQGFTRLADIPAAGLIAHLAGPLEGGGWRVTDVWESTEALEAWAKTLGPVLADLGHADLQPSITPAHNVVIA